MIDLIVEPLFFSEFVDVHCTKEVTYSLCTESTTIRWPFATLQRNLYNQKLELLILFYFFCHLLWILLSTVYLWKDYIRVFCLKDLFYCRTSYFTVQFLYAGKEIVTQNYSLNTYQSLPFVCHCLRQIY